MRLTWIPALLAAAPCCLLGSPAFAQVGAGWVAYDPPTVLHLDGANGIEVSPGNTAMVSNAGATFTNAGGIETFALTNNISNRCERRIQNTYLTGSRQFEGEVRVSPPTNDESVMQVFGGNSGATTQMIRAYDEGGGTLKKVPGSAVLIDKIHGVWVKVNVIHDVGRNFVKTYINGQYMTTGDGEATNAGTDGWYHKYGCYGTLKTASAKVEWRNVKHFRDGTPPADDGPPGAGPASDAAAPSGDGADASSDGSGEVPPLDAAVDLGAGDSGSGSPPGTGGETGGSATGGKGTGGTGRGGSGGARGGGGAPVEPAAVGGNSGCSYAGDGGSPAALIVLLAPLLFLFTSPRASGERSARPRAG